MIVIILVFMFIAISRNRLAAFWVGMIRQWETAAIFTFIYVIAFGVSLASFEVPIPQAAFSLVLNGTYMFCLSLLGLGFTVELFDFEPFRLRQGVRGVSEILVGTIILIAASAFIHTFVGRFLITFGITGPPESVSGLEVFCSILAL